MIFSLSQRVHRLWQGGARLLFAGLALASFCLPMPAAAQEAGPAFIQLEALPDLTSAEDRARSYGASLAPTMGPVSGFRLGTKWYLIVLGPYSAVEAAGKMAALKASGQIPPDAFVTDGRQHGAQFWPAGATANLIEQTPAPEVPPALALGTDTETMAQAQAAESQLDRSAKSELQAALQWYGHYQGALDGAFGRGTRAAMATWQAAMGAEATGVLTSAQRAMLVARYQADQAAFAFAPVTEAEAGIEFSLPTALLAFDSYAPPFVQYSAKDGSGLRLLLISEPGDSAALAGLYDMLQTLQIMPGEGERSLQENEFTLAGTSGAQSAFATARASKGAIKGYLLAWDTAQSETAQRILAVLQSTFRSTGDMVLDPGLVPLDAGVKAGVLAAMAVKIPTSVASGLNVDATGLVLTTASAVANCGKITLDGSIDAEIAALDAALGAAVLRPLSPTSPLAVAQAAGQSIDIGARVLLAGYSLPNGLPAPVLTEGEILSLGGPAGEAGVITLNAAITPYDEGGPVIDRTGKWLGMIIGTDYGGKTLPQGTSLALSAASLSPLLAQAGVATAPGADTALTPDQLNALAMGMTVQVACWP